ncbi:MAG: peptidase S14 [Brevundimonas sp.]|uniref:peptidase S14 n=1 Tax=Brevundimonas sp. TaxID=1871086 RepID=UPI003918B111
MTGLLKGALAAPPELAEQPTVSLHGSVDDAMLAIWLDAVATVRAGTGPLVLELSTTGGDAEVGRRMAEDVRLFRERTGRRALFLGRTTVYSAGVTIMSGFRRADRWLSRDAGLMIHGRKLQKTLEIDGPLRFERPRVEALLAAMDEGLRIERAGFKQLIEGSDVALEELEKQTIGDWYLTSEQALERRLIAGLI